MRLLILAAVLVAFLIPASVQAQYLSACGPRIEILQNLYERAQEVPIARGVTRQGQMLEVTASPSGSWTVLLSNAAGTLTCLKAVGDGFQHLDPKTPEPKGKPS